MPDSNQMFEKSNGDTPDFSFFRVSMYVRLRMHLYVLLIKFQKKVCENGINFSKNVDSKF